MTSFLNRPLTLAEFSSWLQLICAESAVISQTSEQLTARAEKISKVNELLAHRAHEARQNSKQLEQDIAEQQKASQAVRECLGEMEDRLAKLNEEDRQLKERLAEMEQPAVAPGEGALLNEDQVVALEKEQRKLIFLKRSICQSIDKSNVAELLPAVMQRDKLEEMVTAAASNISSWDEILKD
uniref:Putative myosin class ii heavy chain n=1 Tax=Aedes albopictus TaxID=7160 RepID=A0A023EJ09_AEDAL